MKDIVKGIKSPWRVLPEMAHYGRGKPAEMFNLPGLILVYKNSPKILFDRGLHLRSAFKVYFSFGHFFPFTRWIYFFCFLIINFLLSSNIVVIAEFITGCNFYRWNSKFNLNPSKSSWNYPGLRKKTKHQDENRFMHSQPSRKTHSSPKIDANLVTLR